MELMRWTGAKWLPTEPKLEMQHHLATFVRSNSGSFDTQEADRANVMTRLAEIYWEACACGGCCSEDSVCHCCHMLATG